MEERTILVVDDDPDIHELVSAVLGAEGRVIPAGSAEQCLRQLETITPHVLILDLGLPDSEEVGLLTRVREEHPGVPVIVFSGTDNIQLAVSCMHAGAVDFVPKPLDERRLLAAVREAALQNQRTTHLQPSSLQLERVSGFRRLKGSSNAIRDCIELLRLAARSDVTVLLHGESGTGKEIAAQAVHQEGERAGGPFVAVNCGAISETLIESELFGHEKGAFTGATATRKGCFEAADGGTLFLDEVGELPSELQVKLLRVLQERQVVRVGSTKPVDVDVRVIAASLRDLKNRSILREDLFYRLSVFPVSLPPLREREDDILLLTEHFLQIMAARHSKGTPRLTTSVMERFRAYPWPGNVRELENVIERATILANGATIDIDHLPAEIQAPSPDHLPSSTVAAVAAPEPHRIYPLHVLEKGHILRALELNDWNIQSTAAQLQISRATLYRKIAKYDLPSQSA